MKSVGLLARLAARGVPLARGPKSANGGKSSPWAEGEASVFNPDLGSSGDLPFRCSQAYPEAGSLKGSCLGCAPGVTADNRLAHRRGLHADDEFEFRPSFAGPPWNSASATPCSAITALLSMV